MKDQKTKENFIEMRAQGLSYDRIAKELRVSKQTLINWSRELHLQIANLKAIELEVLQEKYFISKEKRIQLFGEKLEAVLRELEKRSLSDIATEKLFDLLQKLAAALRQEEVEMLFLEEEENLDALIADSLKHVSQWKP